jgi:hypothetical protein
MPLKMWPTFEIFETDPNSEVMWLKNHSVLEVEKVKQPLYAPWRHTECVGVQLRSSEQRRYLEVNCQALVPVALTLGKPPGTNWVGDWLGPRCGLESYRHSNPRSPSPYPSHRTDCLLPAHFSVLQQWISPSAMELVKKYTLICKGHIRICENVYTCLY